MIGDIEFPKTENIGLHISPLLLIKMKRRLMRNVVLNILIISLMVLTSCQRDNDPNKVYGLIDRSQLMKYTGWNAEDPENYQTDQNKLEQLEPQIEEAKAVIFLGSWDTKSQVMVPRVLKVLEKLNITDIKLINMDNNLNDPNGLSASADIVNIPTLLLIQEGKTIAKVDKFTDSVEESILQSLLERTCH